MLKNKNNGGKRADNASQNRIGLGTQIQGDIISEGGFRIDGTLNGSIKTPGKIVIGKEGKVVGTMECGNADIEGHFSGELSVENLLSLKSTAVIDGEVITGKLLVEPGTEFNGTCSMNKGVKSLNKVGKGKTA